jgi:hypothetical protein
MLNTKSKRKGEFMAKGNENFQDMTREELYELCKQKGIRGMSHHSKDELIKALQSSND